MGTRCVALISLLASPLFAASGAGTEPDSDEATLRAAHVSVQGRWLLELFRQRVPDAKTQARVQKWIEQLGSYSFPEREEASAQLEACGVAAIGLLRRAAHHRDLEIRKRARQALLVLEPKDLSAEVLMAALRLLAVRKPGGLTETLLDYAPHCDDNDVSEEVSRTLAAAARRDSETDLLVQALKDASPRKRAVAASALCRADGRARFPAVRRLLDDRNVEVRRRVALALLEARDKTAVPVLIDLLGRVSYAEAEPIESLLLQLAGDAPPKGSLESEAERGKYRDAWAEWWKERGAKLDLAKIELTPRWHGYTLAVCFTNLRGRGIARSSGNIIEYDAQGHSRWQMSDLQRPVDAQVLGENRILVTEYIPGQVTERNRNGEVLRRFNITDNPLEARRLPNGHTLITTRSRVVELDRDDKEVWTTNSNAGDTIVSACPMRGGEIGICYRSGDFVRQDRDGKVLASFRVGRMFRLYGTHIQALSNGHILVPLHYENKVVEFDKTGREVWSASYARPASAQRLPNGRTLVASYAGGVYAELDKEGREVKRQRCDGLIMSVRGR
jgi:hypothetical protein